MLGGPSSASLRKQTQYLFMVIQTNNRAKNGGRATPRSQCPGHQAGSVLYCFSLGAGKALREIFHYCNTLISERKARHCVVGTLSIRRENNQGDEARQWEAHTTAILSSQSERALSPNELCSHLPFTALHCTSQDALRKRRKTSVGLRLAWSTYSEFQGSQGSIVGF